jgi:tellurite resistance protein TerC
MPVQQSRDPVPRSSMNGTYQWARRIAISLVGGTVLLLGIVMIVTPGPALLFIPAGLAILGLEFAWARYWLKRVKERARAVMDRDARK